MSLKVHAFELFNSVGKPTAQKMVSREKVGAFASMVEFNALTNTDGIALLKSRFLGKSEEIDSAPPHGTSSGGA